MERAICGACGPCLAITLRKLRTARPPRVMPGAAPTAARLERHAARFGPEQVAETAAEYGVSVAITRPRAAPRRIRGASLKQRVAAYLTQGHTPEVIAEMEKLSPRRTRDLINQAMAANVKEGK